MEKQTLKICITGAAGNIAYSFLPMLCSGQVFGDNIGLYLSLLDLPECHTALEGIKLELEDGLFPNLQTVEIGTDPTALFKDVDIAIFLGGTARQPGMDRKDLLGVNAKIFQLQGEALNEVAKVDCKVLVVANPCNTNCMILQKYCPKLPKKNFTSLNRLDQNRAIAAIAKKAGVASYKVKNIIVWGNHSDAQYPDISFGTIAGERIETVISDKEYLKNDFIKHVQKRGGEILAIRKKSAVLSGAIAVRDHMRDWYLGTKSGEWASMGVYSDGTSYNIPEGIFFSCPVTCKNGEYEIVKHLELDEIAKTKLKVCVDELLEEMNEALEEMQS